MPVKDDTKTAKNRPRHGAKQACKKDGHEKWLDH